MYMNTLQSIISNYDDFLKNLDNISLDEIIIHAKNEYEHIEYIDHLFKIFAEKNKKYYDYAYECIIHIIKHVNAWSIPNICFKVNDLLQQNNRSQMEYGYKIMNYIVNNYEAQIKITMPKLIPIVANDVNNVNPNVKKEANNVLEKFLGCSGNNDLSVFIPSVLIGLKDTRTIEKSVEDLASCVFVQNVEAPALSIITPILLRALNDKKTATKRKACIIIDNMCKLVEHPKEILPFYNSLKKLLETGNEIISDPEARKVNNKALNTLKGCCNDNENISYEKFADAEVKVNNLNLNEKTCRIMWSGLITNYLNKNEKL